MENKKIIAKILPPDEYYDADEFLDDDYYRENIIVLRNRNNDGYGDVISVSKVDIVIDEFSWEYDAKEARDVLENAFGTHKDGREFDESDGEKLITAMHDAYAYIRKVALILEIYDGLHRNYCTLHGCSQGDWAECVYVDEKGVRDSLDYFEAVWFGTGTLLEVDDDGDVITLYTDEYRVDDIRKYVANCCGVDVTQVELWAFSEYKRIPQYKLA